MSESVRVRDRRRRGWFHVDNDVIDRFAPIVGSSGLAVYMALCRRGNATSSCRVGLKRLAQDAGMGRSAVKLAIRKVESAGLIEIRERFENGGQLVHEYVLLDVRDAASRLDGSGGGSESDPGGWVGNRPTPVGKRPTLGRKTTDPRSENDHKEELSQEELSQEEQLSLRKLNLIVQEVSWNLANGHTIASMIAGGLLDPGAWELARVTPEARRAKLTYAK